MPASGSESNLAYACPDWMAVADGNKTDNAREDESAFFEKMEGILLTSTVGLPLTAADAMGNELLP